MSNNEIKQNAESAAEVSTIQHAASDIIESTTGSIAKYINQLVQDEVVSLKDSTIKDLVRTAIQDYNEKLKKEKK